MESGRRSVTSRRQYSETMYRANSAVSHCFAAILKPICTLPPETPRSSFESQGEFDWGSLLGVQIRHLPSTQSYI